MIPQIDAVDRRIINRLQEGLTVCDEPFASPAAEIGISVQELLTRLKRLGQSGILSRVGPMFDVSKLGGSFSLCALAVPQDRFDDVAAIVNGYVEVAHNYERAHHYNMWFVLATETPERIGQVIAEIEALTDLTVVNLPKLEEYFIGMKVEA